MQKIIKWLEKQGAEFRYDKKQHDIAGTLNGKKFSIDGFEAINGRSGKIIGYLPRVEGDRSPSIWGHTTQKSVIEYLSRMYGL